MHMDVRMKEIFDRLEEEIDFSKVLEGVNYNEIESVSKLR